MRRTVSIGAQGFADIRENNYFYVDKTDFIKEWWESGHKVTLITRPRRFGKTLNMNMLECFFSTKYAGRSDLFEGLHIYEAQKYREMQGTWPVIFLSFADIKGSTFKDTRDGMISSLIELYRAHAYLLDSNILTADEKQNFYSLGQKVPEDADKMTCISNDMIARSIKRLANWMRLYYKKNVIILLDEYDTPMQEAYINGYWGDFTALLRSLFNATFKTNPYLERAIMTGITRVCKESIFSDLNNLCVVTTTSDCYATAFGFTEAEVFASLDEMELSGEKQPVKAWYDGFTFGTQKDIYNPWSITNFLEGKKYNAYWANTSGNQLVNKLIQKGSSKIKMTMEELLRGKTLKCSIDEQIVFDQLDDDENAIWSLLLASGYLKVVTPPRLGSSGTAEDYIYELALTNKEVYMMFEGMIRRWFRGDRTPYHEFVHALLKNDVEEMNIYMNKIALTTFSSFDTGNKPSEEAEPERFYHGFVLGLLVDLQGRYAVTSNRESGYGRYDVMLEPLDGTGGNDPAYILEFKVHNPQKEKNLQETVDMALKQIEDRKYATELEKRGIESGRIRKYGFAFQGKKVLIG